MGKGKRSGRYDHKLLQVVVHGEESSQQEVFTSMNFPIVTKNQNSDLLKEVTQEEI